MAPITIPNRIPVKIQLIIVMIIYLIAVYCFELYKEFIGCLLKEDNCEGRIYVVQLPEWLCFDLCWRKNGFNDSFLDT